MPADIRPISLTEFVDFAVAEGPARLTKVRQIRARDPYHPAMDFYKRLRQTIVAFHQEDRDKRFLDEALAEVTDQKKRTVYPDRIRAYKRLLGRKRLDWFDPPRARWRHSGLSVRVNPELGLVIDGHRRVVKLYFKREPALSKRRTDAILYLLDRSLRRQGSGQDFVVGVLDVAKANLITPTVGVRDLDLLLESEATALAEIWRGLDRAATRRRATAAAAA